MSNKIKMMKKFKKNLKKKFMLRQGVEKEIFVYLEVEVDVVNSFKNKKSKIKFHLILF